LEKKSPEDPDNGDFPDRSPKSRLERRREDTRRRLMKATYEIIARRGLEGLVIQDITQAADVGYGTFYNHFTTKDAIVAAVIDASRDFTKEIYGRLGEHASDRAEAFVLELLGCLRLSKADKTWGWFIVRTVLSGEESRSWVAADLKRALDACVDAGAFRPDTDMAYEITSGLLLVGTLKLLHGDVPENYPEKLVHTILQYLGLPAPKIKAILSKPFPDLQLPSFLEAA
jgi:AcrR family transcriptional regulator